MSLVEIFVETRNQVFMQTNYTFPFRIKEDFLKACLYNDCRKRIKKCFGLGYKTLMRYEHINIADKIELLLEYYAQDVKRTLLGINNTFAFYRYNEYKNPHRRKSK